MLVYGGLRYFSKEKGDEGEGKGEGEGGERDTDP